MWRATDIDPPAPEQACRALEFMLRQQERIPRSLSIATGACSVTDGASRLVATFADADAASDWGV